MRTRYLHTRGIWTKHLLSFSWFIPMASVNMAKLSKEQRKWLQTVRNTERNGLALLAVGWTSERQNRLFCCQLLVSQNCFYSMDLFQSWKKKKPGLWTSQTNEGCSVPQSMESSKGFKCDTWIRPKFICDAWILQKGARDSRIYQPVCAICLLKYTWPVNFFFHLCDNSHHFPETLYTRREIWGFPFNQEPREFFQNSCGKRVRAILPQFLFMTTIDEQKIK